MKFGKDLFKSWLAKKNDDDLIGYRGVGNHCPIATCIKETMEAKDVYVGPNYIGFERKGGHRWYNTPKWARVFMSRIDWGHGQVSAKEARKAMKGL